ncbi:hypothetical protein [Confluentibacter sediminis]|uniref:hypothetical protein n=1 Tax=Confluentibacter sediminis TaxID=2219045 RepID=UPI000DAE9D2A|nr:hypothetical protein [Confluentibacter sediminis]
MNPYTLIENRDYPNSYKIIISKSDFVNVPYQEGKITFSFINCRFNLIEIENNQSIDFKDISIQFVNCYIGDLNIENIVSTNISIFFGSSILQGKIKNSNIRNISLNNCILNDSLFLIELNSVNISLTEENIFPIHWKKLFEKVKTNFSEISSKKQSYYVYDTKKITHNINENESNNLGIYRRKYSHDIENKIGYFLSEEEKDSFNINLSISYSPNIDHTQTKIINARLDSLSLKGFANGDQIVENSRINDLYIHDFSSQNGAEFYNIKPNSVNSKLEIHKSNLDKVWFDNVSFKDYSLITFYRNKFGQTKITSCEFPDNYKDFEKFKTVENIHYPEKITSNYFKNRYEVFLQLKQRLENSGNFYESQKFQSISNDALKSIETISKWDKFILKVNSISNNHGLSIKRPLGFMILFSIVFYLIYLLSLGRIFNSNEIDYNLIGYYFSFLDITHRTDFLVSKDELNGFSVAFDYLNKIFVGFFIYQFIAAFRKYGRK